METAITGAGLQSCGRQDKHSTTAGQQQHSLTTQKARVGRSGYSGRKNHCAVDRRIECGM